MFRVDRSSTLIFSLLLVCVSRGCDFNGRDFGFFFLRFFFFSLSGSLTSCTLATLESSAKAANAHRNFLIHRNLKHIVKNGLREYGRGKVQEQTVLVSMKLGWTGGRWLRAPGPIHC